MHLYRSIPKQTAGGSTNYSFPTENFTLNNDHNDSLIRINVPGLIITIPLGLSPEFFCTIKLFIGCPCRVEFEEGLTVDAPEGFYIDGGQTFTICGNGIETGEPGGSGFEVVRNRPIITDNWIKIKRGDSAYYGGLNFHIPNSTLRIMDGTQLIGEYPSNYAFTEAEFDALNNGKLKDWWYSQNKPVQIGSATNYDKEIYFQDVDWSDNTSALTNRFKSSGASLVTGVSTLPVWFQAEFMNLDRFECTNLIKNYPGLRLWLSNLTGAYGDQNSDFDFVLPNVDYVSLNGITSSKNWYYMNFKDCPNLNTIYNYQGNDTTVKAFTISNCPKLTNIELWTGGAYWATGPSSRGIAFKNIDALLNEVNSYGTFNGRIKMSQDYVYTAASDQALADLAARGWDIQIDVFVAA